MLRFNGKVKRKNCPGKNRIINQVKNKRSRTKKLTDSQEKDILYKPVFRQNVFEERRMSLHCRSFKDTNSKL